MGFKLVCTKCGSENTYMSVDGNLSESGIHISCNEEGCDNKVEFDTTWQVKNGPKPITGEEASH